MTRANNIDETIRADYLNNLLEKEGYSIRDRILEAEEEEGSLFLVD